MKFTKEGEIIVESVPDKDSDFLVFLRLPEASMEERKAGDRFSSNKKAVKNESETIHLSQPFWRLVLKALCLFSVSFLCSMRYQRHQKLLLGHWLLRHQSLLV